MLACQVKIFDAGNDLSCGHLIQCRRVLNRYVKAIQMNGLTVEIHHLDESSGDVKVEKVWSDGNENHSNDTVTVKLQQRIQTGTDENDNIVWACRQW